MRLIWVKHAPRKDGMSSMWFIVPEFWLAVLPGLTVKVNISTDGMEVFLFAQRLAVVQIYALVLYMPAILPSLYRWLTRYANGALQCALARSVRKDPMGFHGAVWLWFEGRWDLVGVFLPAQEMGLGGFVILDPSFLPSPVQYSLALWHPCCPIHLSLGVSPFAVVSSDQPSNKPLVLSRIQMSPGSLGRWTV